MRCLTLFAALLCAAPAVAAPAVRRAEARSAEGQVLSVVGEVQARGETIQGPRSLPAGELTLARGARLQLLLPASDRRGDLALSVIGPARLRIVAAAEVELLFGEQLRASGSGRLSLRGLWLLELAGSSAVLDGDHLFVTRGQGALALRQPPASVPTVEPAGAPQPPAATRVIAGQQARLGAGGTIQLVQGVPRAELLAALDHFVAPAWRPSLPRVTLAEVRRAERTSDEQRRASRETASCGCTESKGTSGAPNLSSAGGITPLERQNGRLHIHVVGVPGAQ
jgi:hypothetical protein